MADTFSSFSKGVTSPIIHAFVITPHDSNDLVHVTRNIYVGGGGDLAVVTLGGETVTYKNVPAGWEKQGFFTRVLATGTTATNLVGEY